METKRPTLEKIFSYKREPELIELARTNPRCYKTYTILLNEHFGTDYDDEKINEYCITRFGIRYSEHLKYLKNRSRAKKGNGRHKGDKNNHNRSLGRGCNFFKRRDHIINNKTSPGYHYLSTY